MIGRGELAMVFSSIIFVFAFLPITLLCYFIAEKTGRVWLKNTVLLIASLLFYAWGGVQYLLLLLGLVFANYITGLLVESAEHKKLFLIVGLLIDLLTLVFYKYLNFLVQNLVNAVHLLGNSSFSLEISEIALPIGISFFTFQAMSYLVDVYRGVVPAQKNVAWLTLYIMMFPQLIAGPIVRYKDVNNEIASRKTTPEMLERGIKRFILGFAKKVFIANCMGNMADAVFSLNGTTNCILAWIGAGSYALQIYFDFSAYSDMAIGLGGIFGFHFNENFDYPYVSKSIQEFWRRWHISLSTWFRDYVYIPLGGNRKGRIRTYLNLSVVFLLTGIWHGAAWQFVVWGLIHGAFMLIERAGFRTVLEKIPGILRWLYTMLVVIIGWVFFRADSLASAMVYVQNMFSFCFDRVTDVGILSRFTNMFWIVGVLALLASTPVFKRLGQSKLGKCVWLNHAAYLLLFALTIIYLSGLTYNPFIYFKF